MVSCESEDIAWGMDVHVSRLEELQSANSRLEAEIKLQESLEVIHPNSDIWDLLFKRHLKSERSKIVWLQDCDRRNQTWNIQEVYIIDYLTVHSAS